MVGCLPTLSCHWDFKEKAKVFWTILQIAVAGGCTWGSCLYLRSTTPCVNSRFPIAHITANKYSPPRAPPLWLWCHVNQAGHSYLLCMWFTLKRIKQDFLITRWIHAGIKWPRNKSTARRPGWRKNTGCTQSSPLNVGRPSKQESQDPVSTGGSRSIETLSFNWNAFNPKSWLNKKIWSICSCLSCVIPHTQSEVHLNWKIFTWRCFLKYYVMKCTCDARYAKAPPPRIP